MHIAEQLSERPELAGEAFNLSNEIQLNVLELVDKMLGATGSELRPEVLGEASNEIEHQYLDAAKAREMLNWRPLFTLDEGFTRTIEWYKNYFQTNSANQPLSVVPVAKSA
jgi:CDP-glucose 4,6-dehydratase